jgi:hypothetical protein
MSHNKYIMKCIFIIYLFDVVEVNILLYILGQRYIRGFDLEQLQIYYISELREYETRSKDIIT